MRVLTHSSVLRRFCWFAVCLLLQASLHAQPALQRLDGEFVRRSAPGTPQAANSNELVLEKASGLSANGVTLEELIGWGYKVVHSQISGGPDWIDTIKFDVSIKPHAGETSREQSVQRFLKARFRLAAHSDTAPVFILSVGDRGPKVASASVDPRRSSLDEKPGQIVGKAATMKQLAEALSRYLRRPVLDHTRLGGQYDFSLKWRAPRSLDQAPAKGPGGDSALQAALRSDLGLEMASFPYESLIIDHAELPGEE